MLSINATENLTVSQHNAILPDDPTLDRSLAGRQELIFRKLLRRVGDVILCVLISLIASWSPLPNLSDPPTPTVGAGTKVGAETSIPGAGVGARAGAGASITGTSMGASLVGSGVSGAEADASGAGGGITSAGRGAGGVGAGAI